MEARIGLTILGSTGTIGKQTLDVVRSNPDKFRIIGLSTNQNIELLKEQILEFNPECVCVASEVTSEIETSKISEIKSLANRFVSGEEGMEALAQDENCKILMLAVTGFSALKPLLVAIKSNKAIAIANKEAIVTGGSFVMDAVSKSSSILVPVDSEHNSIYQALQGRAENNTFEEPRKVTLTASGGPFLSKSIKELESVTVSQAINHPRWKMGAKISVDSATLMNKGLEVIEASVLFGLPASKISVLVHPQVFFHAFVEFKDGSTIAVAYPPSMRVPIANSLAICLQNITSTNTPIYSVPEIQSAPNLGSNWNVENLTNLEFFNPDLEKFPLLGLAYQALNKGGASPTILNAANEVAVQSFIDGKIPFLGISKVVSKALEEISSESFCDIKDIFRVDKIARNFSNDYVSHV